MLALDADPGSKSGCKERCVSWLETFLAILASYVDLSSPNNFDESVSEFKIYVTF